MNRGLGILIGSAVFVYLVTSFLVATLDIRYWYDHQRFFAVVAYFLLVSSLLGGSRKDEGSSPKKQNKSVADSNYSSEVNVE